MPEKTLDKKFKNIKPDKAAANCPLPDVHGHSEVAEARMESLVSQGFAEKKKAWKFFGAVSYSINQSMINPLTNKRRRPYNAGLAKKGAIRGEGRDFTKEAHEFNLAAYNAFLTNAYVQAATKFFHDKYCREGLETYSERRYAKLLGVSRTALWRWKMMAEIPEDLFQRLLARGDHLTSTKEMANIGRALNGHGPSHDAERCPHCGEVLRVRGRWRASTAKIVNEWLSEQV